MTAAHYDAAFGGMPEPTPENEERIRRWHRDETRTVWQSGMKELRADRLDAPHCASQNQNRAGMDIVTYDENFKALKILPVFSFESDARMTMGFIISAFLPAERVGLFDPAKS